MRITFHWQAKYRSRKPMYSLQRYNGLRINLIRLCLCISANGDFAVIDTASPVGNRAARSRAPYSRASYSNRRRDIYPAGIKVKAPVAANARKYRVQFIILKRSARAGKYMSLSRASRWSYDMGFYKESRGEALIESTVSARTEAELRAHSLSPLRLITELIADTGRDARAFRCHVSKTALPARGRSRTWGARLSQLMNDYVICLLPPLSLHPSLL